MHFETAETEGRMLRDATSIAIQAGHGAHRCLSHRAGAKNEAKGHPKRPVSCEEPDFPLIKEPLEAQRGIDQRLQRLDP